MFEIAEIIAGQHFCDEYDLASVLCKMFDHLVDRFHLGDLHVLDRHFVH
jgi:hypothetical protein